MRTAIVVLSVFFVAFPCSIFSQETKAPTGAWMPVYPKWERAPTNIAPNLQTASTRILYFQPDGKMLVIGCVVDREQGSLTISGGDGLVLEAGEWRMDQGKIIARTRLVFRTVHRKGEMLPGLWNQYELTQDQGSILRGGMRYRRVPELDKSAAELVPRPSTTSP